ncbi:HAD family hydrolase [Methylobacterium sp. CM6257]
MTPITRRPSAPAFIFDVDGVLLASPHERTWRAALAGSADPRSFTIVLYPAQVAGKPRLDGTRAALAALGLPDAERPAPAYADAKQLCLERIVAAEGVTAFPDALRFVRALADRDWALAAASSSKNAEAMMRADRTLLDAFAARVCGRALRHSKPDPEIFLLAAAGLRVAPARCFVAEDAPMGIRAARAGGMTAIGIARLGDADGLRAAGADRVVTSFDEIRVDDLAPPSSSGDAA